MNNYILVISYPYEWTQDTVLYFDTEEAARSYAASYTPRGKIGNKKKVDIFLALVVGRYGER